MRKLFVMAIAVLIVATACSSGKYADKIDKAVNKQQAFQKKLHKIIKQMLIRNLIKRCQYLCF